MSTESPRKRAYTTVVAPPEVDIASSNSLRTEIESAIAGNAWVIVDLSGLEFIDSTGLGTLLSCHHRADQYGGNLVLVGPNERTRKLLRITQLDAMLEIYPSAEDVPQP